MQPDPIDPMVQTLRLSAYHVSSKDLKVLRSLLGLSGEQAGRRWIVDTEADDGDAVLIDVDNPDGAALWPELNTSDRRAVALTKRRDFPAHRCLHKPIRSQQLQRLLGELGQPDGADDDEAGWPTLVFGDDEDDLPLAEHLRRHSWDQPILIGGDYLPELVIDPGAGVWYSSASDRELSRLLRRHFVRGDAQPLASHELVEHTTGLEQQSLANLKWRAGLALSSGALHPDLAGEVRFMLPQVPLQALSDTAYSRQARVLIRRPVTAGELMDVSGAEKSDVAEFLNACHTCGFLLVDASGDESASNA